MEAGPDHAAGAAHVLADAAQLEGDVAQGEACGPLVMAMEWCWLLIHQAGPGNALSGDPILAKLTR